MYDVVCICLSLKKIIWPEEKGYTYLGKRNSHKMIYPLFMYIMFCMKNWFTYPAWHNLHYTEVCVNPWVFERHKLFFYKMTHLFWRICSLVKMLHIWCEDCVDLFTECSSHIVWNIAIQILTLMKYKSNDIVYQKGYKVLTNDMKYVHWRYECYNFLCNFLGGLKFLFQVFH